MIRVPSWIENPLGRYYLYFAGHKGTYIRLAFAEKLEGPWEIYKNGNLHIEESYFPTEPPDHKIRSNIPDENVPPHIASPDVHINEENKEIRMYFHGLEPRGLIINVSIKQLEREVCLWYSIVVDTYMITSLLWQMLD